METSIIYEDAPQVPLTDILPELEFEFTDAPQGLLAHLLRRTLIRFCNVTNAMRREAIITTQSCVPNYLLELPDGIELIAVMRLACIKDRYCRPDYQRVTTTVDNPRCCCFCAPYTVSVNAGELVFDPPPSHAMFKVDMSVMPSGTACSFDRALLHYEDVLLDGARARMYAQTGKPWSSAQRAVASDIAFQRGCADAAVDAMLHQQRGAFRGRRRKF